MFETLASLLERGSLSPHGICLLWRSELIWTHVVADLIIGFAYFSIPVALGVFVTRRRDVAFGWIFWAFAIFILACGTTHFFSIWTLWVPDYGAEALVKALTAIVSLATAILLWPLLPKLLALPSPEQLRQANAELRARIQERDEALEALRLSNDERDRAEEMLRQTQKMEAIGALTGGVAHDFNNLLGIVIANLDRVDRTIPDDSRAKRSVQNAVSGAERAAALVQKMLAFARRQPLQPSRIEPNQLIGDLFELLRGALGGGTPPQIELADDLWAVSVDANQLESVLLNLAVNARDAMPEGGTVTIRTRNLPAAASVAVPELRAVDYVAIEVSDTGRGMSEAVAARAFEPFFTTKAVGQGTGLGLSQVFGFAKQSEGHVTIASVVGSGTTVRLYLPRYREDAAREAVSPALARENVAARGAPLLASPEASLA